MAIKSQTLLSDSLVTPAVQPWMTPFNSAGGSSKAQTKPPVSRRETGVQEALDIANVYRCRSASKAFLAIFGDYVIIGTCIAVSQIAHYSPHILSPWPHAIYGFAVLIISSRLRGLENLVHEASHNNLFSNPKFHSTFEFLYAFPVFRLLDDYRHSHMIHHKHLGDPNKDPDVIRLYELGLYRIRDKPIWYLFGVPLTGFLTYDSLNSLCLEFWKSPTSRRTKSVYWLTILVTLTYTRTLHLFAYYYLVSFLLILPITRYWAEASEHVGLDLRGTFGSSRNNLGWMHRWYMHPHSDGYHAVHHLHSKVPFHKLPVAHEALMKGSQEFKAQTVVSRGMGETFWQMATQKMVVKDMEGASKWE
jgi:fatty acid desaturase